MNLQEAYQVLELDHNNPPDEDGLKKQFRKLAAQWHPDKNKDPIAEKKSKEIGEAFAFIKDYKENPPMENPFSSGGFGSVFNIQDIFGNMFNNQGRQGFQQINLPKPIEIKQTISFAESILSCQKTVSLERNEQCQTCQGVGYSLTDKCSSCQGAGYSVQSKKVGNREIRTQSPCSSCQGSGKNKKNCESCKGEAFQKKNVSLEVKIPGGISNNSKLRLSGQGHFHPMTGP